MKRYRHNYDKILARLTTILTRLNDGEKLCQKELAKEFGVSERTIERDFYERLKDYPLKKIGKKWQLVGKLGKTLSIEERIVLDILDKVAQGIGGNFYQKSHHLLKSIKESTNPFYLKIDIENIEDKLNEIALLEKAIKERRKILCEYKTDKTFKVTLSPLKIANYQGFWYLVALDKDTIKKYYLKNIMSVKVLKEHFDRKPHIDKLLQNSISIWFNDQDPINVKLFIEPEAAKYFKRKPLPTQMIVGEDCDGSIEIELKITHKMEILPLIKEWIPHIIVLEPEWLVEEIKEELKTYIQKLQQIQR